MFNIQEELKKLPDKPGVYIMKDENGVIIYIGKAVVLKNRVRQYFQASSNHSPKVLAMVARVSRFEYIVTDTELEALILECNLIKKHKPKFNILLKDDKTYPYIKVTMNEDYPRILKTRKVEKDGAKYFGPYSNVTAVNDTLDLLKKIFPVKSCTRVLPRDIGKGRPCLNYHIGQCMAPCQGGVNRQEYRDLMKDICSFLDGKHDSIVRKFEKQMQEASENLEFEKAASLRNKINSLKHIAESQKVVSTAFEDQDVIGLATAGADACTEVFFIRGGKLVGRESYLLEGSGESETGEIMSSFLKQFYSTVSYIPRSILLQYEADEADILEAWLTGKRGKKVNILVPQRGEKHQLVEMNAENAKIALEHFRDKLANDGAALREGLGEMAQILRLEKVPERIEAYDISNTGTADMVASMVVFENGSPARKEYRRFKIKTLNTQNDYGAMQEVLFRRFRHAFREIAEYNGGSESAYTSVSNAALADNTALEDNVALGDNTALVDNTTLADNADTAGNIEFVGTSVSEFKEPVDGKFSKLPDLILLDGGQGHVSAVGQVLKELGVTIPAYGMVKDDNHRTRGLVMPGREVDITGNLRVLRLVTTIQDEAHRFALDYNKRLRKKRYTGSVLDEIEGIGPGRRKALLKHFGSIQKIKQAGRDDLLGVDGITKPLADRIFNYFH